METQLVNEFVSKTGASPDDALSCLKTWGWDLKKALIDYNDTSTTEYFNGRTGLKVSMDTVDCAAANVTNSGKSTIQLPQLRKPSLTKLDSIDIVDYKKLNRGISRATENENLVSRARSEIAADFHNGHHQTELQLIDTPDYTFTLPDLSIYSDDFRKFLEKDLIECSTLNSLESAKRLNWWSDGRFCRKLWPLATTGDGNCLLHAASLAMWGFHDRKLTLRAALHGVLSNGEYKDALWRRWRFQQTRLNKQAGFVYSENEWTKEWEEIVSMASPEPRQIKGASRRRSVAINDTIDDNATYDSLEEIHIFALAHVLRRSIIVVADTVLRDMNGEAMAPIPFGGVYLPFEIQSDECNRAPLLLTYDMAHFSALVSMEAENEQPPALIPLIDYENVLLPIQFCIDPGRNFDWKSYDGSEGNWTLTDREHIALLKEYLDIVYATPMGSPDEEISVDLVDDEYEKRFTDAEFGFGLDENGTANGKSKAAKQLQSVAKQFGSIGKSMSKKIKKNIGSIAKIGSNTSNNSNNTNSNGKNKKGSLSSDTSTHSFTRQRILCAQLKAKRHDYQEEMIKNYLECAQDRFTETEKAKELREIEQYQLDMMKKSIDTPPTPTIEKETNCINAGCQNYGTSETCYMCKTCFEKQKEHEMNNGKTNVSDGARFGTGNSKFYAHADVESHKSIKRLPSVRRLNDCDQTLYLSNSTFYDTKRGQDKPIQTINGTNYAPNDAGSTIKSKTIIIPIRMEGNDNIVDPSRTILNSPPSPTILPPITPYFNTHQTSNALISSPPHNILGIAKDDSITSTPSLISCNSNSGSSSRSGPYTSTITIGPNIDRAQPISNSYSDIVQKNGCNDNINTTYVDRYADTSRFCGTTMPHNSYIQPQAQRCRTKDCPFFGSANTNYYCSKCCQYQQPKSQSKILTDV